MEGMVHISNLAESRPKHPSEVLKEGDAVRVRVLGIDRARRRIDLGIRQAVEMAAGAKGAAPARGFDLFAGLLKDVKVRK
jgi:ribosomal protein S1